MAELAVSLLPRKYERHVSKIGGTSGGLGRGGHTREFWSKVRAAPGGCLVWIGYLDKDGAGKMTTKIGGKVRTVRPHRLLWERVNGPIPEGHGLFATCGRQDCVAPPHRKPMTQAALIRAARAQGRWTYQADTRGELSGRAKLNAEAVREIRAWRGVYGAIPLLARLFGVSREAICGVLYGKTWRHLKDPGGPRAKMPLERLRELVAQRVQRPKASATVQAINPEAA